MKKPVKKAQRTPRPSRQDEITNHIISVHGNRESDDLLQRCDVKVFESRSLEVRIEELTRQLTDTKLRKKDVDAEVDGYMQILRARPPRQQMATPE